MDKRYAIFDMDGTLVESMEYWKNLSKEYLKSRGVADIPQGIMDKIKAMTIKESAELFINEFTLADTAEAVAGEMNRIMEEHYKKDIPLKEGCGEYLRSLKQRGTRMCVASATAKPLVEACLKRLGVLDCFEFLLSCEDVGAGKTRPDVYIAAADKFGSEPAETAVYEDAHYALSTAKEAGFYTVAVYDNSAAGHWEELGRLSDEIIIDWRCGK